ncbi:hypothetical protein BSKO_07366 [Bryopsis sp. KO-2023]|nr:hypothetical protein BSKO_07366 [Bryopsis sp. KO-2023]
MFSGRCELCICPGPTSLFAPLPPSTRARRDAGTGRLHVIERDFSSIVEEEKFRKKVDALERSFDNDVCGAVVPVDALDSLSEEIESPSEDRDVVASSSALESWTSWFEDFTIPFDYFQPLVPIAVALTALGIYQSMQADLNLDAFSLENMVQFQLPVQGSLFAAVFLQAVAGWGFALAAITGVSTLAPDITVSEAQALVALVAIPVDAFMFYPYLKSKKFDKQVVDKWVVGAMVATPIGVTALKFVDENLAMAGLGATILAYCAYATFNVLQSNHLKSKKSDGGELTVNGINGLDGSGEDGLKILQCHHSKSRNSAVRELTLDKIDGVNGSCENRLEILQCQDPECKSSSIRELALNINGMDNNGVKSDGSNENGSKCKETGTDVSCNQPPKKYPVFGTWGAGFIAGVTGGAFDVPGPPLVVFADLTGMASSAELTRANLLAFFALDSQLVAMSDLADGRFDVPFIWQTMVLAIPSLLLANAAGNWCSKFVDQERFRCVVIGLLAVCGLHQVGVY